MQLFSSNFKLGILGGGQLGKMLLYDAKRYDLHTKVMDSNHQAPCAKIADEFIVGDITNYQDVIDFGNNVDIITVEIEKINTDALLDLEKKGKKVYPSAKTLQIIQNKSVNIIEIWDRSSYEKAIADSRDDFAKLAEEVMGGYEE